jgi:hypothetical protein|tara:strand:+ start:266 stop:373 length:108 start_codon:yes stop_codon:yes gene_type:complete
MPHPHASSPPFLGEGIRAFRRDTAKSTVDKDLPPD